MNSSDSKKAAAESVIRALATLHEKMQPEIEKILEIAPNLMEAENLEQLPKEKVTDITHQYLCMRLARPDESIDDDIDILVAPMLSVENKELIDWYKNEYKPFMDKVFMVVLGVETSSGSIPSIRSKLAMVVDLAESWIRIKEASGADGFENIFGLQKFKKFMEKSYFEPDEWMKNESGLPHIFVADEIKDISPHVKERINEIYRSFVFGNWMSVVALSRSLLEFALIDKKSLLEKLLQKEIEIRNNKGQIKRIRKLASIYEEAFPELKDSMETVIEYGNYVMHPDKRITPKEIHSKQSVEEINKIISQLYSHNKLIDLMRTLWGKTK